MKISFSSSKSWKTNGKKWMPNLRLPHVLQDHNKQRWQLHLHLIPVVTKKMLMMVFRIFLHHCLYSITESGPKYNVSCVVATHIDNIFFMVPYFVKILVLRLVNSSQNHP